MGETLLSAMHTHYGHLIDLRATQLVTLPIFAAAGRDHQREDVSSGLGLTLNPKP